MNVEVGVYHHATGIDASSSASLAAYINTLTYGPSSAVNKVTSGLYWFVLAVLPWCNMRLTVAAATMRSLESICVCKYRSPEPSKATVWTSEGTNWRPQKSTGWKHISAVS